MSARGRIHRRPQSRRPAADDRDVKGPAVRGELRKKMLAIHGGSVAGFDSSYKRKESIEFPLNRVIAGWTEGVQLMQEGSKYRFYIPSKLAYGPRGAGRDIGPNEALIFDVELIKVK